MNRIVFEGTSVVNRIIIKPKDLPKDCWFSYFRFVDFVGDFTQDFLFSDFDHCTAVGDWRGAKLTHVQSNASEWQEAQLPTDISHTVRDFIVAAMKQYRPIAAEDIKPVVDFFVNYVGGGEGTSWHNSMEDFIELHGRELVDRMALPALADYPSLLYRYGHEMDRLGNVEDPDIRRKLKVTAIEQHKSYLWVLEPEWSKEMVTAANKSDRWTLAQESAAYCDGRWPDLASFTAHWWRIQPSNCEATPLSTLPPENRNRLVPLVQLQWPSLDYMAFLLRERTRRG